MIPFVPLIQEGEQPFSMFQDLIGKHDWVLDPLQYDTLPNLIQNLENDVVEPALEKRDELLAKKVKAMRMRRLGENRYKETIDEETYTFAPFTDLCINSSTFCVVTLAL